MDTFTNGRLTFDVDDSGPAEGDVIVLLHGFPETKRSWQDVAPLLSEAGYRVLAPNQRGYARDEPRRSHQDGDVAGDAAPAGHGAVPEVVADLVVEFVKEH